MGRVNRTIAHSDRVLMCLVLHWDGQVSPKKVHIIGNVATIPCRSINVTTVNDIYVNPVN